MINSRYFHVLLIAALAIIQLKALPGDYLGKEHDDIQHVLLARSMLHGKYILGVTPGETPMTTTTPGMPLLLLPAALISGDRETGYHFYAWLWLVLCDILVYAWFRWRLPPVAAALGAAAFGLNPLVLARAGSLMTEVPGLTLTMLLLIGVNVPGWPAAFSGWLTAFIWLVRQSTIALIPAVSVWYLWPLRRKEDRGLLFSPGGLWSLKAARRRQAFVSAAIPAAVIILWSLYLRGQHSQVQEVKELHSAYGGRLGDVFSVAVSNIGYYSKLLGGMWSPWPASGISTLIGLGLAAVSGVGCAQILIERGVDPAIAWLLFAGGMYVFWPWQYERYLLPLLPMFFWALWEGILTLVPGGRSRSGEKAIACVCATALLLQFFGQSRFVLESSAARNVPECRETYQWIRTNLTHGEALSSAIFARDAWYTGHPFSPLPDSFSASSPLGKTSPELAWLQARRICCVLWQDDLDLGFSKGAHFEYADGLDHLRRVLEKPPFKAVYRNPVEKTAVYKY